MKAVVIFSGGQDSTTCLGVALADCGANNVSCIAFNYGQKHAVELQSAETICEKYGIPLKIVDLTFMGELVTSALTDHGDTSQPHEYKEGLPASFVPNRNALFITLAHAYAQEIKAERLYTGVCQTDYSGYPDCRDIFIRALEVALNTGYETCIAIHTPLMFKTKAQTFDLAEKVGFLNTVRDMSHTCYNGDHSTWNVWGFGCGECPACKLRANGWKEYCRI